jgi:hypothetical protein
MTEKPQELIARLQKAMHNESAAHSPRTTFAIEAMRAAQTYIAASLAREAGLREALEWIKQNDETGPTLYEEYPEGSGRFREEGNAQGPFGVRARAALQVQP